MVKSIAKIVSMIVFGIVVVIGALCIGGLTFIGGTMWILSKFDDKSFVHKAFQKSHRAKACRFGDEYRGDLSENRLGDTNLINRTVDSLNTMGSASVNGCNVRGPVSILGPATLTGRSNFEDEVRVCGPCDIQESTFNDEVVIIGETQAKTAKFVKSVTITGRSKINDSNFAEALTITGPSEFTNTTCAVDLIVTGSLCATKSKFGNVTPIGKSIFKGCTIESITISEKSQVCDAGAREIVLDEGTIVNEDINITHKDQWVVFVRGNSTIKGKVSGNVIVKDI